MIDHFPLSCENLQDDKDSEQIKQLSEYFDLILI